MTDADVVMIWVAFAGALMFGLVMGSIGTAALLARRSEPVRRDEPTELDLDHDPRLPPLPWPQESEPRLLSFPDRPRSRLIPRARG